MFWNRKKKNDYTFFNLKNKKYKVIVCIKDNNFIYISVDKMEEAFEIIEDIKSQMKG